MAMGLPRQMLMGHLAMATAQVTPCIIVDMTREHARGSVATFELE